MAVNTNHTQNKIVATENNLVLDAVDALSNISASSNRLVNVSDPVDLQDAVTKKFLEDELAAVTGSSSVSLEQLQTYIDTRLGDVGGILDLLSPQSPSLINTTTLSILYGQTHRITDFTQVDNTSSGLTATAGTSVNNVLRSDDFTTSTISQVGPGNSGTIQIIHNEVMTSETILDNTVNDGTATISDSLVISNNVDYGTITGNPLGFHYVYNAKATGTNNVPAGWNNIRVRHELTSSSESLTNTVTWYSDQSSPSAPAATNATITPSTITTGVLYSSTIPHYTSAQKFDITFDVANLSGDFYPATDTFITSVANNYPAAVDTISNITYTQASITTPLPRNHLTDGSTTSIITSTNIKNATGISPVNQGQSINIDNSYQTTLVQFPITDSVLYMTPTSSSVIVENDVTVNNVGFGSGDAIRYETVGTDTPIHTPFLQFDGQNSTLNSSDATIVGGILSHDVTNYSTGYLPVGPDLSVGREAAQYIEFGFNRTAVSKFAMQWSGKISGCWVKIPGTSVDNTSTLNGWLDVNLPYEGIGIPGENTGAGGNGSNGCGLAGIVTTDTNVNSETVNITFGTESSSNATNTLILVRFKLQAGDSINALMFKTAT